MKKPKIDQEAKKIMVDREAYEDMIDALFDARSSIIQSQKFHGTSGSKLLEKIEQVLKKAGCTK